MPVDESVTVKGSPVRSLQKFIEADLTPDERERMFATLPVEYRERFRKPILPTETIAVHVLNVLTEAAAKVKGEKLEDFARRAGRAAAGEAVKGIYRFFALVLTPAALLSKAGPMWSSLYNKGDMRVVDQTPNSARIVLAQFPSELAGCNRTTGWIERMAELTGVKDIRIEQTQCFAKGAPACEWNLSWR